MTEFVESEKNGSVIPLNNVIIIHNIEITNPVRTPSRKFDCSRRAVIMLSEEEEENVRHVHLTLPPCIYPTIDKVISFSNLN